MADTRLQIRAGLQNARALPAVPGVIQRLNRMADDGVTSIAELAKVVATDQVLSAKVLKLVNSPFYGLSHRVSSISSAMIMVGVNVVKGLAVSSAISSLMEKGLTGLWQHSLGVAAAAAVIARRVRMPDVEEVSTAGLLHDIGRSLIRQQTKDDFRLLVERVEHDGMSMLQAEQELLDVDHAEVGGFLATAWNLPTTLIEPITCHHDVTRSVEHRHRTAVVHLADVLVKATGFGFSGDDLVPRIQPEAWERLGLNADALAGLVDELEEQLIELENVTSEVEETNGKP